MDVNFCENCENITELYVRESDSLLVNHCRACNISTECKREDRCIYKMEFGKRDKSISLNRNQYLTQDVTLPKIKGNENIKCTNAECPTVDGSVPSSITYIKYDLAELRFMYICDHCGQKWVNT